MHREASAIAVGILCKTPAAGISKTRLSPPLSPAECAEISACFIRDLAETVASLSGIAPFAIYTPRGSEAALRALLPARFHLHPQVDGDFAMRVQAAFSDLLAMNPAGAILVNSDSPTLPAAILQQAVEETRRRDVVVLSPALDGGYTLIGLSRVHAHLFFDIPWSTPDVHRLTLERARESSVPVVHVPDWYDVDDAQTFELLEDELAGRPMPFAHGIAGAPARHTRAFMAELTRRALRQTF